MKSDNELMLRIKDGELHLMEVLFERHGERMHAFFKRNVSSKSDAEDLLQNLFERMLRYRKTYRAEAKFTTWMYQVASNLRADHFKDKSKNVEKRKAYSREIENRFVNHSFSDVNGHSPKQDILEQGLSQLPEDKREILILGKYEGLRYKEIGKILGCKEGAVKVRVYRALKELKEICHNIAKEKNYDL